MMELVIGGSGSGKSACAETLICRAHRRFQEESGRDLPLYYIADMIPYGKETEEKIRRHREMRAGKGFHTLEWYFGIAERLSMADAPPMKNAFVLLECISNLTANEMYEQGGAGSRAVEAVVRGVRKLRSSCRHLVVVTNDVFRESTDDSEEMALYKKNLGAVNAALAGMADQVIEVVCGIPVKIKPAGEDSRYAGQMRNAEITLIVGGAFQGKRDWAEKIFPGVTWADGADCSLDRTETVEAIDHFHLLVKRWMRAGRKPEELTARIIAKTGNTVILCDEIGCGLVPVDAFEREYREAVGRICGDIASHARRVERVTCGIATRIR